MSERVERLRREVSISAYQINLDHPLRAWQQVVHRVLCAAVTHPRTILALPSIRDGADGGNCSRGTVKRAYKHLQKLGVVVSAVGQHTQTTAEASEIAEELLAAQLTRRAEQLSEDAAAAGFILEPELHTAPITAADRIHNN